MRLFKLRRLVFSILLVMFSESLMAQTILIAHRGATGYLPEHTLKGYELAIRQGADFIEPDLVITKDGILIARHDIYLSTTTDVGNHPEFASRKRTIRFRKDWFIEDFTLAELKTLRARQAFRGRSREHDGKYEIPTFQEIIDLVKRESKRTGRTIGLYPEAKSPSHFNALGMDYANLLVSQLETNGLNAQSSPVFIQSFDSAILRQLNELTEVRLIQLVTVARDSSGQFSAGVPNIALTEIAKFCDGVGAIKYLLVNKQGKATGFVNRAKALGLLVHVWTFRDDDYPRQLFASAEKELAFFLDLGIDGFFTDFPDTAFKSRLASGKAD